MRFLCLHGMGTNSDIFAAQLGSVLGDLEDMGNEFIFVDGNYECKPTNGTNRLSLKQVVWK